MRQVVRVGYQVGTLRSTRFDMGEARASRWLHPGSLSWRRPTSVLTDPPELEGAAPAPEGSKPVFVLTRNGLRRLALIAGAVVVGAGVAIGAYTLGRSRSPSKAATTSTTLAHHSTPSTTTSTTAAPTTTATTSPPITSPPTTTPPVLSPATVAPVSAECNEATQTSADGNVSPLLCPKGEVNVAA